MSNAVDITNLGVSYGATRALDDVSFSAGYGEVVALLGPNGAGKTTLVETLLGFHAPTNGTVRLHGLDPHRDHREVVARTGALLQRGGVWAPMSPRDVLRLSASYYEAPRDVEEILSLLALNNCARTPWRRLSGGEQQRTLLALALLGRPKALVLDEPTTAVDPEGREVIRAIVRAERDRGCLVLLTTHELHEAELLADHIIIIHHGRFLRKGTLQELTNTAEMIIQPSGAFDTAPLAALLGCSITSTTPLQLRCDIESTPQRIAIVTNYLESIGLSLVALRTHASLEESYLEIIRDERSGVRS